MRPYGPYGGYGGGGGMFGGGGLFGGGGGLFGGPLLTRHARRLQTLAGAQAIVGMLIFLFGIALFAVFEDEYSVGDKYNMYLWSSGLPSNALMPPVTGAMGMITAYFGWRSIRTRKETKSTAMKQAYIVLGIIQMIFFDLPMVYYGFHFISVTTRTTVGNGIYTRATGEDLPDGETAMVALAGILAFLSFVNFCLFFLSNAISCMCCDPFVDRFPHDFEMDYRPRAYSLPPVGPGPAMYEKRPRMGDYGSYGPPELRY